MEDQIKSQWKIREKAKLIPDQTPLYSQRIKYSLFFFLFFLLPAYLHGECAVKPHSSTSSCTTSHSKPSFSPSSKGRTCPRQEQRTREKFYQIKFDADIIPAVSAGG